MKRILPMAALLSFPHSTFAAGLRTAESEPANYKRRLVMDPQIENTLKAWAFCKLAENGVTDENLTEAEIADYAQYCPLLGDALKSGKVSSNDDVSKFLQYSKNVGSVTREWVGFVKGLSGMIIGTIGATALGASNYPTSRNDLGAAGVMHKAMVFFIGLSAITWWDSVWGIVYQGNYATTTEGLVTKDDVPPDAEL